MAQNAIQMTVLARLHAVLLILLSSLFAESSSQGLKWTNHVDRTDWPILFNGPIKSSHDICFELNSDYSLSVNLYMELQPEVEFRITLDQKMPFMSGGPSHSFSTGYHLRPGRHIFQVVVRQPAPSVLIRAMPGNPTDGDLPSALSLCSTAANLSVAVPANRRTEPVTASKAPIAVVTKPPTLSCGLGVFWTAVEAERVRSTWIRRGMTDVFDGWGDTITVNVASLSGNTIKARRTSSSDGHLCTYEGTIAADGETIQGTYTCPGYGTRPWGAVIHCGCR